jgi:pimeloyl-ACP methyl ester carboxylesterase
MRIPVVCGAAVMVLALAQAQAQSPAQSPLALYEKPQALAALPDGRKINLVCQGQGSPVVILTAGAGDWSTSWNQVQPLVARKTRVCAWDRAGYGFSDASLAPQSAANLALDLEAALKAAAIAAPYVLVGHSAGAFESLQFTARYPREVGGLVLVDPTIPDLFARVGAISPLALTALRADLANRAAALHRCAANPASAAPADAAICFRLPEHARPLAEGFAASDHQPARLNTRASLYEQFEPNTHIAAQSYGNLPLAILTSQKTPLEALPVEQPERTMALDKLWTDAHDQLAAQSSRGSNRVLAGAGHQIQLEQPQIVADTIGRIVDEARAGR